MTKDFPSQPAGWLCAYTPIDHTTDLQVQEAYAPLACKSSYPMRKSDGELLT